MKRIAFVNQRYGKEVNGGSEYYTMLMANKLKMYYKVEVLTSKALSYDKWEDYYDKDIEDIDGITVRRFGVKRKRNCYFQRLLKELIVRFGWNTEKMTSLWNIALGPYVPNLIEYIKKYKEEYDAFIFVTYMYYPTVFGMQEANDKAIFVPTAHDEYNIYFKIYEKIFRLPKKIVYLTNEEKEFVQGYFHNSDVESQVIGVGVDVPQSVNEKRFREKYGIMGDYIIYAGRVDMEKGCNEMFDYFMKFIKDNVNEKLHLIVMGVSYMDIPDNKKIRYLGFVPNEDKYDGIKGAKALWLPSKFESLSIAVLESMSLGIPVIVNGRCEVLKGHCKKSNAGVCYNNYGEFKTALQSILVSRKDIFEKKCKKYIEENYRWENIIQEWIKLINC